MTFTKSKLAVSILIATSTLAYANEEATQLGVIDVVAENSGTKSKTDVVTIEQINKGTAADMRAVLKAEPSINFGGGTGTSQWATIRGMGQDQIDFKVDNTSSDSLIFHHQSRFMLLDPSLIKRVSIVKGSGSASAGIGATSGQISVTTVDAKDLLKDGQNFGFKVNSGYSSNKGYSEGGSLFGRYGNVDALVIGNWVTEKEYKSGNGTKPDRSALGQRGLLAKIGVDLDENNRLVISQRQDRHHGERTLREEFDFTLDPTLTKENEGGYRITTTDTTNLEYVGKNLGFISNISANTYTMKIKREDVGITARGEFSPYLNNRIVTKGANLNLDSYIANDHIIKYGVNWREQEGKPNELKTGVINQKKEDVGVYAEGIWGFGPATVTTGVRYDHFDFRSSNNQNVSKGKINPSVGLIYGIVDGLTLNAVHNYATRSPRLYEIVLAGGKPRGISDNLKAERSRNTEVGFNYNLNDAFSLKGSYFWTTIKDAYGYKDINGISSLTNSGKIENRGYELDSSYRFDGLTLRTGVAYSKPEIYGKVVDSHTSALRIGRIWTTGVSYQFENPSVEVGWNGRFVEGEKGVPTRGSNAKDDEVYRPGYGVNDFYVNWQPTGKKDLNINLALNNAFNKYYRSHTQRTGAYSLPERGRDFRVNVNYTF